jgi:hypothetical protein
LHAASEVAVVRITVPLGGGYAAVVLGLGRLLGRDSSLAVATVDQTMQPTQATLWLRLQEPSNTAAGATRRSAGQGGLHGRR